MFLRTALLIVLASCSPALPRSAERPHAQSRISTTSHSVCVVPPRLVRWATPEGVATAYPDLASTIDEEPAYSRLLARVQHLSRTPRPEVSDDMAMALAHSAATWIRRISEAPFTDTGCEGNRFIEDQSARVIEAVRATRDFLEHEVLSSTPLLALRQQIGRVVANQVDGCDGIALDERLSAVLTSAFELIPRGDWYAQPGTACQPFRTLGIRFRPREHIELGYFQRDPRAEHDVRVGTRLGDDYLCPRAPNPAATESAFVSLDSRRARLERVDNVWRVTFCEQVSTTQY